MLSNLLVFWDHSIGHGDKLSSGGFFYVLLLKFNILSAVTAGEWCLLRACYNNHYIMQSSGEKKVESISKDVEMYASLAVEEGENIKRDLKSRHIKLIVIAGMIVSCSLLVG